MPPRTSDARRVGQGRRGGALGCLLWLILLAGAGYVGWKLGTPYVQAWRFEDVMKQEAAVAERRTDAEIRANLRDAAERLRVPLGPRAVRIRRGRDEIAVAAEWSVVVEFPEITKIRRTLHFQPEVKSLLIDEGP